jgi:tetratricopeptide (TPR) repeat protein
VSTETANTAADPSRTALFSQQLSERRLHPDDVRALDGLGDVYTRDGRYELARVCFAKAIAIHPEYVPALINLGNPLHHLGRLDDAVAAYQSALSLAPDEADASKNLAMVCFAQGKLTDTVSNLTRAKDLEKHVPARHTDLGYILFDVGESQQAAMEFKAALDLDPAFVPALVGMALLHEQRGEPTRAIELLRHAIRSTPTDINLHYTVARLATGLNDFTTATKELDIVLKLDPQHIEAGRLREISGLTRPKRESI